MSIWSPPGPPGKRTAPLAEDYRETPLWWDDTTFPDARRIGASRNAPMWSSSGAGFTGLAAAARLASHGQAGRRR